MAEQPQHIRIESVDWPSLFPFFRLFRSFRMAIHPTKLALALLLVLVIYLAGWLLDLVWGAQAYPGEVQQYATLTTDDFSEWRAGEPERVQVRLRRELAPVPAEHVEAVVEGGLDELIDRPDGALLGPDRFRLAMRVINRWQAARHEQLVDRREHLESQLSLQREELAELRQEAEADEDENELEVSVKQRQVEQTERALEGVEKELAEHPRQRWRELQEIRELRPQGIFATIKDELVLSFQHMVNAALGLNFGLGELAGTTPPTRESVVGAIRHMLVTVPSWLWQTHPFFLVVFSVVALAVWSLVGGTIARLAATDAALGEPETTAEALHFARRRWLSLFVSPLLPLILIFLLGILLSLGGVVFFNVPVLDIVGGLLFVLALALGVLMALVLVATVAGVHLFYPAIAVEGTDALDAMARGFNYFAGRPWRWLFYNLVALVYGAITYLFVGGVIFLALWLTQRCVGYGVFVEASQGVDRFEAMLPPPQLGVLDYPLDWWALGGFFGLAAAVLVKIWVWLLTGLIAAYAISFYLSAQTWIYLLLRRAADGVEFDDIYLEPEGGETSAAVGAGAPAGGGETAPAPATGSADHTGPAANP